MKNIVVLVIGCLIASIVAEQYSVELTPQQVVDIANNPNTQDTWVIKFYGPNCGFCKGMEEQWETFAKEVAEEELDLKVGQLNVHDPEVQGTPGIRPLLPGPLPGIHLFFPGEKKFYEFPNPRLNTLKEQYLNFVLTDYERSSTAYRKDEYFYEEETDILNISGENFYDVLESAEKPLYVFFFGTKCGWCKTKMPLWEEFATASKQRNAPWTVARLDGFSNLKLVDAYNARPWPSVVYIQTDGKYYRIDTEIVRDAESVDVFFDFIEQGTYLEADEEHSGFDQEKERQQKLRKAKEESKRRKKEKAAKEDL